jgi:hypothetical protein
VTIAVLDAGGRTARSVLDHLRARRHDARAVAAAPLPAPGADAQGWAARVVPREAGVVVAALGRRWLTPALVAAALDRGVGLVEVVGDPGSLHTVARHDAAARAAGVALVPASGFAAIPGDPLAALAVAATAPAGEVHVAYAFPGRGGARRALGPGSRAALAALLGQPVVAYLHGREQEEAVGEARRLAWFPRPIGPAHAAGVPGPEPITLARHVPDLRSARTSLAVTSLGAELLQAAGTLGGTERGRRLLARRLVSRRSSLRPEDVRWACVAEADGASGVARAWAYGTDPCGTGAVALAAVAVAVAEGRVSPGWRAPSEALPPEELLDALSARSDLRWSVKAPG